MVAALHELTNGSGLRRENESAKAERLLVAANCEQALGPTITTSLESTFSVMVVFFNCSMIEAGLHLSLLYLTPKCMKLPLKVVSCVEARKARDEVPPMKITSCELEAPSHRTIPHCRSIKLYVSWRLVILPHTCGDFHQNTGE
jgi:hypothetical protein